MFSDLQSYLAHKNSVQPGEQVGARLIPYLRHDNTQIQLAAIDAIENFQTVNQPSLTLTNLIQLLNEDDFRVVHAASRCLVTLFAIWPPCLSLEYGPAFDPLPLELASDPE